MVHPECSDEVVKMADFTGSTTGIIKTVKESNDNEFIIVTEKGVVERLQRDCPNKKFVLINEKAVCNTMKLIRLEDILHVLQTGENEINIAKDIAQKAITAIDKMLKI